MANTKPFTCPLVCSQVSTLTEIVFKKLVAAQSTDSKYPSVDSKTLEPTAYWPRTNMERPEQSFPCKSIQKVRAVLGSELWVA